MQKVGKAQGVLSKNTKQKEKQIIDVEPMQ